MTETRESLTRTFCALCHAAMGVASEPACEEVVVVLAQKIERTARALRDLRPKAVLAPGPYAVPAKADGECVCGHSEAAHEVPAETGVFKSRGCLKRVADVPGAQYCKCLDYAPLPF